MNENYIGKYCPYCKTPFSETDDIVVCSQCDMPHHKDCWVENGGCTTFGCLGTIKSVDPKAQTSVTSNSLEFEAPAQPTQGQINASIKYCTQCGAQNNASSRFCGKCGTPMGVATGQNGYSNQQTYSTTSNQPVQQQYSYNQQYNQQQYSQPGQQYHNPYGFTPSNPTGTDAERLQFVGRNQAYYAEKFANLSMLNKKTSWNWCAFLFAPYWFIYRKMYGYGFGILAAAFVLSLIGSSLLSSLPSLVGYIALGIFANYIYMKNIDNLISQMRTLPDTTKYQFVAEKGGVNKAAAIWTAIGYTVLSLIMGLI